MWTPEKRTLYDRSHLRYPSDLSDEEWELIKPQIAPAKRGGRKREVDEREIVKALFTSSVAVHARAATRQRCELTSSPSLSNMRRQPR